MPFERFCYDDASRGRDMVGERLEERGLNIANVNKMAILGSGLGGFAEDHMEDGDKRVELTFGEVWERLNANIEPVGGLVGHDRKLIIAPLKGGSTEDLVLAQAGREHLYEGVSAQRATFWLRIAQLMGVQTLIASNASGILFPSNLKPGDLMMVNGHVDDVGGADNPLIGANDEKFGPRFPHMGDYYPEATRAIIRDEARDLGVNLREGTYVRVKGPTYESRDDVYKLRALVRGIWQEGKVDGDGRYGQVNINWAPTAVVGMSSVYEALVAQHASQSEAYRAFVNRAWISVPTNYAAMLGAPNPNAALTHDHVKDVANAVGVDFGQLVRSALLKM